jgi:hypothetical protein
VHTLYRRKRASEVLREAENISEDIFYQNYDAVEAILKCTEQYRRGFLGSEALVSLKRTPNNTLSIFWYEGKEKNWPAPFPRN